MGVAIETTVWEPNLTLFIFMFIVCFFSLTLFPHFSKNARINNNKSSSSSFDHSSPSPPSPFLRFHRHFLLLYSLASVMEGVWSVFGEFEFASKDQMLISLSFGYGAALLVGTFLGMLSDSIGHKKCCLMFCILHLFVGIWKRVSQHPGVLLASVCLSLATSLFSFSFESWVVTESEKMGHRRDTLGDTFWLMTFLESASLIGSQVLVNWLVGGNVGNGVASSSSAAIFLALVGVLCVGKGWKDTRQTAMMKDNSVSYAGIFSDKRIWLLGFAQACLHFSIAVFWILWAPTLVADGREVNLGLIYPCLLGARMLGSTVFPWLLSGLLSLRTEDCLFYVFVIMGLALSLVAYDYQEIGVLVMLFCLFHAGVGLAAPSLARLRTMHVPDDLRGGMMSISLAPANATILFLIIQRGYYGSIENSTMMAIAALGLFMAAACMHLLKRWGKQPYQNWHKS
ncbi:hypothetical protein Tsubulata_001536 [Turnera subulata]|uniref:Uncharacterized protein n=1 Tax=Turnera subulata TaxID=218843 RepID=A0A9Q0FA66_9ROSI|nr:hypothetical protein Tsubulata_001536 [Turnera subulata]